MARRPAERDCEWRRQRRPTPMSNNLSRVFAHTRHRGTGYMGEFKERITISHSLADEFTALFFLLPRRACVAPARLLRAVALRGSCASTRTPSRRRAHTQARGRAPSGQTFPLLPSGAKFSDAVRVSAECTSHCDPSGGDGASGGKKWSKGTRPEDESGKLIIERITWSGNGNRRPSRRNPFQSVARHATVSCGHFFSRSSASAAQSLAYEMSASDFISTALGPLRKAAAAAKARRKKRQ